MDIIQSYNKYLSDIDNDRQAERENEEFHASSAGSCYRKQMYSFFGYETKGLDDKSLRLLRLGTIVHEDLEKAMSKIQDDNPQRDIYIEEKVSIPELNVVGTFDLGERRHNVFDIYDYKTVAAYKWTTKFGRKDNRVKTTDRNYKLQLGTYGLAISQNPKIEKVNLFLIWYNKNTSMMREQLVDSSYIKEAKEYWEDTNDILDEFGEEFHLADELEPGVGYGTPFEDWECRYCSYNDVCPTPIK